MTNVPVTTEGWKVTAMVQLALPPSTGGQLLVCAKAEGSAPVTAIPEMDTEEAQLLPRVRFKGEETPPYGSLKSSKKGRRVTQGGEPAPMPRRVMDCGLFAALSVTTSRPVSVPATSGAKSTFTGHS